MSGQRRRRCPNIKPTLGQRIVLLGLQPTSSAAGKYKSSTEMPLDNVNITTIRWFDYRPIRGILAQHTEND